MANGISANGFCTALVALSLGASACEAADWPQWRGPNRDGTSNEKGLLEEWPTEGPKLLWRIDDLGEGFSTPSVATGRLYVQANKGLDDELVKAFDIEQGNEVWSFRLGNVGNPKQQPSYPAARSTPTVDGDVLFALGSDGDLVCLAIDSGNGEKVEVRWQRNLRTDFGGKPGIWAYSESPLIDGDVLVCTPGGAEATLVALDKKTGELIWKCALEGDEAAYASAVVFEAGGVRQYVQLMQKGLVGVHSRHGIAVGVRNQTVGVP